MEPSCFFPCLPYIIFKGQKWNIVCDGSSKFFWYDFLRELSAAGKYYMIMCEWDHRVHTERQWPLSGVKSAQPDEDGGCTPSPFHSIYYHEQNCGVRSNWEGRYTPPISPLSLYAICELDAPERHSVQFCVHLCVCILSTALTKFSTSWARYTIEYKGVEMK